MTSIGSGFSPLQAGRAMMDARISAAVSAGTVSSKDQTALESALDNIDSAMSASSGTGQTGSMKDRMNDLIDQQVSSGTLTDDQASELKDLFAQGPGGAQGIQGPPPPPPADGADDASDTSDTGTASTAASSTSTDEKKIDTLITFLETLRASYAAKTGTYGAAASSVSGQTGVLVDTSA